MEGIESKLSVYQVTEAMNKRGVLTLTKPTVERLFQVVAYEDERLRRELAKATAGSTVQVRLTRTPGRACVYRATRETDSPAAGVHPSRSNEGLPVASWRASASAMTKPGQLDVERDTTDGITHHQSIKTRGKDDD